MGEREQRMKVHICQKDFGNGPKWWTEVVWPAYRHVWDVSFEALYFIIRAIAACEDVKYPPVRDGKPTGLLGRNMILRLIWHALYDPKANWPAVRDELKIPERRSFVDVEWQPGWKGVRPWWKKAAVETLEPQQESMTVAEVKTFIADCVKRELTDTLHGQPLPAIMSAAIDEAVDNNPLWSEHAFKTSKPN